MRQSAGQRIGILQRRNNLLLVGHGHTEAANGNIADTGHQVFHAPGVQCQVNGVYRSRRKAEFIITGESVWDSGSPTTPYTCVA